MSTYSETELKDAIKPMATIEKEVDTSPPPVSTPPPALPEKPSEPSIPFWLENPNVLFTSFEFFPSEDMTYTQKLNALSRMVIVLTLILYGITRHFRILIIGVITLAAIYFVYNYHLNDHVVKRRKSAISKDNDEVEGFENVAIAFPPTRKSRSPPTSLLHPIPRTHLAMC